MGSNKSQKYDEPHFKLTEEALLKTKTMIDKITCPKCGNEFELEDALSGKLEAHYKAEFDKKSGEQAEALNAEKLSMEYKTGKVIVHLSKRRGIRCLSLLKKINEAVQYDRKLQSPFSRLLFLFTGLFEILRVLIFHSKLFEILLFYYKNKLSYDVQRTLEGEFIFHFR